jgi:hypothetical protein
VKANDSSLDTYLAANAIRFAPGISRCDNIPQGPFTRCGFTSIIFGKDACVYNRVYEEVIEDKWLGAQVLDPVRWRIFPRFRIQTRTTDTIFTAENGTIPSRVVPIGTFVTLQSSLPSLGAQILRLTNGETYRVTAAPPGLPAPNQIGDLQSNSQCLIAPGVTDLSRCTVIPGLASDSQRDGQQLRFRTPVSAVTQLSYKSKLPGMAGGDYFDIDDDGIFTLLTYQVRIEMVIEMQDPTDMITVIESQVCPSIDSDSGNAVGCFECAAGFEGTFTAWSTCDKGLVRIESLTPGVVVAQPAVFLGKEKGIVGFNGTSNSQVSNFRIRLSGNRGIAIIDVVADLQLPPEVDPLKPPVAVNGTTITPSQSFSIGSWILRQIRLGLQFSFTSILSAVVAAIWIACLSAIGIWLGTEIVPFTLKRCGRMKSRSD